MNAVVAAPFRTILWPVGLDADSNGANLLKRLSLDSKATVFLLYLITNNADSLSDEEDAETVLTRFARENLCPPDYRVLMRHASSSFRAKVVLETAQAINADLILMTTRTHGGFAHLFREDLTQEVLTRASCPVLVVDSSASHRSAAGAHTGNFVPEPGGDARVLHWHR